METTSSGLLTNGGQDWHEVSGQPFGWFIQRTATAIPFRLAPLAKGYSFNASPPRFGFVWQAGGELRVVWWDVARESHNPLSGPATPPGSREQATKASYRALGRGR